MDDDYYDDMGMEGNPLEGVSEEELMEMLQNYDGELTPELMDMLQSYRQPKSPEVVYSRSHFSELFDNCMLPTWTQLFELLLPLFVYCIIFRILLYLSHLGTKSYGAPHWLIHLCSAVLGLLALNSFFKVATLYIVVACFLAYFAYSFVIEQKREWCGLVGAVIMVVFSLLCELFFVEAETWHKIRGAQIILFMKVISLGVDIGQGTIVALPSVVHYAGYCFNVGTVIFGPWISYPQYSKSLDSQSNSLGVLWILKVLLTSVLGVVFLTHSNCFTNWLILDHSWRWFLAYRDAQSFRFSHYSISFLSEATSTLSGIKFDGPNLQWNVARPHNIELPRSLVEVVTNWNLPMHFWLKTYVFKLVRPYGTFLAVILTYAASALLHGLNFQLAAVLFSLGFYSYTEFVFRRRLSHIFDACIQARKCKEKCDHKYTRTNPFVIMTNFAFSFLAVFHLAYLGLMFDSSDGEEKGYTMWHTLEKWSSLNYLSHWIALGTFIFYWLI
uniref:Protein-serine O-palmitoleoyltransferase porcupine n=1 Tax=Biomphalaria glabrata TaxID=6526 RepID=A0A2C9KNI0_BIOGL